MTMSKKARITRWKIEKIAWVVITVMVILADTLFNKIWLQISIVYLAIVSNYALVLTAAGAQEAATAAYEASSEE